MIKAPFNFVPSSKKVFYPDILGEPSIDVPFSNAISGSLELKITAETPIFIRNGHTKEDADKKNSEFNSFSKAPDGRYFIPATSIKGCIRNVLSIMSSGEQQIDKRASFTQRDFNNPELYTIKSPEIQSEIHCGWLKPTDYLNYYIVDCGKPLRISMKDVDKWFETNVMANHFSKDSHFNLNKEISFNGIKIDPKTARFKYLLLENKNLEGRFTKVNSGSQKPKYGYDPNGNISGTLVMTGQPGLAADWNGKRKPKSGKYYEFIFPSYSSQSRRFPISEEKFEQYDYIYSESEDWKFHKDEIHRKGIPVFFRLDGNEVLDFGLAFMYKLPYLKTPYDIESIRRKSGSGIDMAKRIFGYSSPEKSLRGRVTFSNFFSNNAAPANGQYKYVLGTPKASYYPLYIKQNAQGGKVNSYLTYNDATELAGFKMYLRRFTSCESKSAENENLNTDIFPLKTGSEFTGKVIFHNLRPEELGALVAAITFNGNKGMYHTLGQGKPYGFGRVSIEILSQSIIRDIQGNEITLKGAMDKFNEFMSINGFDVYKNAKELFYIAGTCVNNESRFEYMEMGMTSDSNEFVQAKNENLALQVFSEQIPSQSIDSILAKAEVQRVTYEIQRKEALKKELDKQEEEKQLKIIEEQQKALRKATEERIKVENEQKKQASEKEKLPLSDRIKGYTSLGALAAALKKWVDANGAVLTDSDLQVIADKMIKIAPREKDRDSKKKDFIKNLGEQVAEKLYSIIIN